jgi:membrane protein DedA with SNARE-associated domain
MELVIELFEKYGLIAIFLLIFIEYACFPLPSEIILPFAGATAVQINEKFAVILLMSIIAGLLGSLICYYIGYFGGRPIIDKLIQKFPKMSRGMQVSEQYFNKYSVVSVCLCRVIPLCRTYISFVSGICRQNVVVFLISSSIGIAVWNTVLIGMGFIFYDNWTIIAQYYEKYKLVLIIVLSFSAAVFLFYKIINKHIRQKSN